MRGPQKEHWMHLCELIAEEQDPKRFSELTKQLLAELDAKDKRLKPSANNSASPKTTQSE
jgi:hypothetical protein